MSDRFNWEQGYRQGKAEAADEIERLRAALQAITHDCAGIRCDGCHNAIEIARRALEQEMTKLRVGV